MILVTKKCCNYAACGVSQTPNTIEKRKGVLTMNQEKIQNIALMRYSAISPLISGLGEDYTSIEAVLNAANGTPRMINKFCNFALLIGNSKSCDCITADIIMQAVNDNEPG